MDSATLLGQLQQAQANTSSASDLYNSAVSKYNIPEIRSSVAGLRTTLANTNSAINNVAPSVAARSQGTLVTGGQQNALANLERQPLDRAYAEENTSLTNKNADLTNLLGEAQNEANLGYKSGQDKIANLKDLLTVATNREQAQRDEAYRASQAAENQRQFNVSQANSNARSAASSSAKAAKAADFSYTTDTSGGFQFKNPQGKPATAAQYVASTGGNFQDLVNLLGQSKNPGDAQIIKDMNSGMSQQALTKKYPWVFSGV